jgi:8-oxo-dGTP pyrophosphatase MutT (NUDIX family)
MKAQLFQVGIKALVRNKAREVLMVHIPAWSGNDAHWDLPGGRVDPGEKFLDTLNRELLEEIGCPYMGTPKQLSSFITNITIPVDDVRIPLVFVIYEVEIADTKSIKLDPESAEDSYDWFSPDEAAEHMKYKFSEDFCKLVSTL